MAPSGDAPDATDAEAGDVRDGTAEIADGTEPTDSTESTDSTERPSRRSRSNRGGRSRRGRDTSDAGSGSGPGAAEDAGHAGGAESTTDNGSGGRREPSDSQDAGDSGDSDQSDDGGSVASDDDTAPRRSRRRRGGKGRRGRGGSDEPETESAEVAASAGGSTTLVDSHEAGESGDHGGAGTDGGAASNDSDDDQGDEESASSRRRRRRRRSGGSTDGSEESPNVSTRVRQPRVQSDEPVAVRGSTRLEAKKQRRREGREAGRRRTVITEAEFLARREAVDRVMVVRNKDGRTQMGVLEDGVLVEHYIDQATNVSMAGNIYLGRVQNVLPSMEAAFVDIGKGRNAVLYAGEVNWDAAGLEGNQPKRIEHALGSGQAVLVQVTKDPIGHKGARLTSQISLPGRYLVYVPNSSMTGISRKLPDTERARLKKILRDVVPESAGVIVRTAAEGASEDELRADVERLTRTWEEIQAQAEGVTTPKAGKSKGRKKNGGAGSSPVANAPALLHGEPDLTVRVIRDVFNEDFSSLVVSGDQAWDEIHPYITSVAPDLAERVTKWTGEGDLFTYHRVDEQLAKAMDRKVWLPSGGSLVIDRTEAMTVVDVNTGKFVGSGGNLEETVTKNNIEAAEEIVRQLRLRDIGGIIVVDFIDMVLESNRDLVVRRLLECLGRDRTKHQVAEVTSLGLVQMTRKRVGSGLIEVFGETCSHCNGRGFIIHSEPVDRGAGSTDSHDSAGAGRSGSGSSASSSSTSGSGNGGRGRRGSRGSDDSRGGSSTGAGASNGASAPTAGTAPEPPKHHGPTAAQIAAAAHAAALKTTAAHPVAEVAEAAVSIADDLAAELASAASPTGIDRAIEAQVSSTPDIPEPAGIPAVDPADDSEDATVRPDDQMPATQSTVPVADGSGSDAPAARPRRRRGRVMAPAGPPRPAGSEADHEGVAPQ
ncbi:MAG: Rne/Rng family ribonuclease [Terracoccus sp.]